MLLDGRITDFAVIDPLAVERSGGAAENRITAPMTGLVRSLPVEAGAAVAKGDILVVLEAMKMEHALRAAADGVVEAVHCAVGDTVSDGTLLVEFAPSAAERAAGGGEPCLSMSPSTRSARATGCRTSRASCRPPTRSR